MVGDHAVAKPRWQDYVLIDSDNFAAFWDATCDAVERALCVGQGLRSAHVPGLDALVKAGGLGTVTSWPSPSRGPAVALKCACRSRPAELGAITTTRTARSITERVVPLWSEDRRRRIGASRAAGIFTAIKDLADYTDIVVDISAMPRSNTTSPSRDFCTYWTARELARQRLPPSCT